MSDTPNGIYQSLYESDVNNAASANNLPPGLLNSVINTESSWNPYAVSPAGAIGLTQLMPSTAQSLGVDPNNTLENINGGAQYLSQLFNQFGNWTDALRAYNVGPTAASSDPTAGLSYAQSVLSGAPGVQNTSATSATTQPTPAQQILGNTLGGALDNLNNAVGSVIGTPTTQQAVAANDFWSNPVAWIENQFTSGIWTIGLLLAAIGLLYFAFRTFMPGMAGQTVVVQPTQGNAT